MWFRALEAMKGVLPCPECSAHYNAWIVANPPPLPEAEQGLQDAIVAFILELHNDINIRNGKDPWTVDQVRAAYQDKAAARAAMAVLRSYLPAGFLRFFTYII